MISAQVGEKRMLLPKKHKYSLFRVQALSHAIFNGIGQERKDISENCWDACGGWNRAERCMDTASIADRRCSAGIKLSHRAEQAARDVAPAHKVWTCKVFPSKLLLYNPAFAPPTGFLRLGYPLTFGAVHTTSQCPGQGLAGACRQ